MGLFQNIFRAVLPASMFTKMEAESHKWMVKCRVCSAEQNIWDLGGIRYGSTGGKTATRVRCQNCSKNEWHTVYYAG